MSVCMTELGHIFFLAFYAEVSKKELDVYLKIPNFLDHTTSDLTI